MNKQLLILPVLSLSMIACCPQQYQQITPGEFTDYNNRPAPTNSEELLAECDYLKQEITRLDEDTEKMSHSRFAMHYHALNSKKVAAIQKRIKKIGCS